MPHRGRPAGLKPHISTHFVCHEKGFVTFDTIGFEGRFDNAAIRTVSNVASRLCDEAKPGQILISPRVLALGDAVTVELIDRGNLR
jgi:hypothetical protein